MIGMQTKYHVIRKKVEKRMKKRTYRLLCVLASTVLLVTGALTGCGGSGKSGVSKGDGTQQTEENGAEEKKAPKIDGLKYQKTMQLKYATGFDVYYYKGGYKLLDVHDDRQYLIVPEGKKKPADLDKDIVVLKQPLDHIYLAATSAMALFDSMDGLDSIRMSGAQASDWYIDNAKKAMEEVAEALDCECLEIRDKVERSGTMGYLRCCFDAMHKRTSAVSRPKCQKPLSDYKLVILGTPVWAGRCSSVIRGFLKRRGYEIQNAAYLITHKSEQDYKDVFRQMDLYLQTPHVAEVSLCPDSAGYHFWRDQFVKACSDFIAEDKA